MTNAVKVYCFSMAMIVFGLGVALLPLSSVGWSLISVAGLLVFTTVYSQKSGSEKNNTVHPHADKEAMTIVWSSRG